MADNDGLLSLLECPVCFEYITPPIYQCINQHLICSCCHSKQRSCPICRGSLKGVRNICMEKVTNFILYPCKYEEKGCRAKLTVQEKENHEQTCIKSGTYKCLVPKNEDDSVCDWTGLRNEYDEHLRYSHTCLIIDSNDGHFNSEEMKDRENYFISFDDNIFRVLIYKDTLRTSSVSKVYTFFFHIVSVSCEEEKIYAYNVSIQDQNDSFEGFVGDITHYPEIKDLASKNECFHFMGNNPDFKFEGYIVKIV